MYYTVYKTTNIINGKFYIGMHQTDNLDDGYLGSGTLLKKAIKKYGRENFKKQILVIFDNFSDMIKEERRLVDEAFVLRRDTYNYEIGGSGGKVWTPELREKLSNSLKGRIPWNKNKKTGNFLSEEDRKFRSMKMSGSNNPMYGINVASILTPERDAARREKISKSNKKPKSKTDGYKKYASSRFWIVNKIGKLCHATDENDHRLISGEYRRGRIWIC